MSRRYRIPVMMFVMKLGMRIWLHQHDMSFLSTVDVSSTSQKQSGCGYSTQFDVHSTWPLQPPNTNIRLQAIMTALWP